MADNDPFTQQGVYLYLHDNLLKNVYDDTTPLERKEIVALLLDELFPEVDDEVEIHSVHRARIMDVLAEFTHFDSAVCHKIVNSLPDLLFVE